MIKKIINYIISFFVKIYNWLFTSSEYYFYVQFRYLPEHERYICYKLDNKETEWLTISGPFNKFEEATKSLEMLQLNRLYREWKILKSSEKLEVNDGEPRNFG